MTAPGQAEMLVGRRLLVLARAGQYRSWVRTFTVPAPRVTLWTVDPLRGLREVGRVDGDLIVSAVARREEMGVPVARETLTVNVSDEWQRRFEELMASVRPLPDDDGPTVRRREVAGELVVLWLVLSAAVIVPAVIIAAALGLL